MDLLVSHLRQCSIYFQLILTNFVHISPSSENPAIMLMHSSEPVREKKEQPKSDHQTTLNNSENASPGVLVLGKSSSLGARSDVITFLR